MLSIPLKLHLPLIPMNGKPEPYYQNKTSQIKP